MYIKDFCYKVGFDFSFSAVPTYPTDNNNGEAKPAGEIISEWSHFFFPIWFCRNILFIKPSTTDLFGPVQTASAVQPVLWTTPADRTLRPGPASANWVSVETTVTPVLQDSTDSTVRVGHSALSWCLLMVKLH